MLICGSSPAHAQPTPPAPAATPTPSPTDLLTAAQRAREAGRLDEAEAIGRRAIAAAEVDARRDATLLHQAHIALSQTLLARRRFDDAIAALDTARTIARAQGNRDHPATLVPTVEMGDVRLAQGRFDLAEPIYREALALSARVHGADGPQTISLHNDIASIFFDQGRPDDALALIRAALAGAQRNPRVDEALRLRTRSNLASLNFQADRWDEAEPQLREVLAERTRRDGPDNEQRLLTASNLATLYLNTGRLAEAEAIAPDILARAERALGRDHPRTLLAASVMGQLRAAQGRYDEAERLLRGVLEAAERLHGLGALGTIQTANLLGRTLHEAGRYAESEALYRRAAAASAQARGADDPVTLITRNGIAMNLMVSGSPAETERLLREIVAGFARSTEPESLEALQASANLATILQLQGRFGEAEPLMLATIATGERTLGPDDPHVLLFVSNLAEVFFKQRRLADALLLARRASEGADRRLGPDSPRALLFANNLGTFLLMEGEREEATRILERTLAGRERIYGFDNRDTLVTATSLATLRIRQGRIADALALVQRTATASERVLGANHPETIGARLNLATLYQQLGRLGDAAPLLARILTESAGRLPLSDDMMIEAAGGLSATRQFLRLTRGETGLDALTPARQAVAGIRARRTERGGRFGAAQAARELRSRGDYFLLLADALWDKGPGQAETAEAFAALQDAAAGITDRAVLQNAVRRFADTRGAGLGALVREREELEDRWAATAQRQVDLLVAPDVTAAERDAIRDERNAIETRLDAVEAQLRQGFPDYFQLANPQALDLDSAASVLAEDEVLLMIVPGNRGTHLMAVTRRGIEWRVSALTAVQVAAAARRLLWQAGASVTPTPEEQAAWSQEPATAFDRTLAHRLYQELVAPMAGSLAGKRHVYIAASGALSSLPFGMLVTQPPQGRDDDAAALRATRWLADAHALVQVPSVQSMLLLRRIGANSARGERFIGFGDPLLEGSALDRGPTRGVRRGAAPDRPIFAGRTRGGKPIADAGALRSMARLPGTAEELRNLRSALNAPAESIFLGAAATEARLRSMDLGNVRILALATHGITAGEIAGSGEPGLVLTPPAEPSEADDGYLAASEIAALRLSADWVILSACNTAAGDGSEGAPGLSGLARAFFHAGARTLLASHWPVRDDVGARLVVRAVEIERAEPTLSRAEAFQRAMREIRNDAAHDGDSSSWAHPSAWAPFTLIGDAAR